MFPADKLVGHRDPHHVQDPRVAAQVQRPELLEVTDEADDRAGYAAADEGLATSCAHQVDDRVHLTLGGLRGHHHHHAGLLLVSRMTKAPSRRGPGLHTSLASAQSLAGDRPRAGKVAKPEPVLALHEP